MRIGLVTLLLCFDSGLCWGEGRDNLGEWDPLPMPEVFQDLPDAGQKKDASPSAPVLLLPNRSITALPIPQGAGFYKLSVEPDFIHVPVFDPSTGRVKRKDQLFWLQRNLFGYAITDELFVAAEVNAAGDTFDDGVRMGKTTLLGRWTLSIDQSEIGTQVLAALVGATLPTASGQFESIAVWEIFYGVAYSWRDGNLGIDVDLYYLHSDLGNDPDAFGPDVLGFDVTGMIRIPRIFSGVDINLLMEFNGKVSTREERGDVFSDSNVRVLASPGIQFLIDQKNGKLPLVINGSIFFPIVDDGSFKIDPKSVGFQIGVTFPF